MESNKLTVEEFARKNIGKSFKTFDNFIICSSTKDDGWNELIDSDIILIQSPLNVSFFYITPKYEYYRMQLQLP